MFGFGISEVLILLIVLGGAAHFVGTRGALAMSGPVLVVVTARAAGARSV